MEKGKKMKKIFENVVERDFKFLDLSNQISLFLKGSALFLVLNVIANVFILDQKLTSNLICIFASLVLFTIPIFKFKQTVLIYISLFSLNIVYFYDIITISYKNAEILDFLTLILAIILIFPKSFNNKIVFGMAIITSFLAFVGFYMAQDFDYIYVREMVYFNCISSFFLVFLYLYIHLKINKSEFTGLSNLFRKQYKNIILSIPDVVFVINNIGKIESMNQKATKIFKNNEPFFENILKKLVKSDSQETEFEFQNKFYRARSKKTLSNAFICRLVDETSLKKQEKDLKNTIDKLQKFDELSLIGFMQFRLKDNLIIKTNSAFAQHFGDIGAPGKYFQLEEVTKNMDINDAKNLKYKIDVSILRGVGFENSFKIKNFNIDILCKITPDDENINVTIFTIDTTKYKKIEKFLKSEINDINEIRSDIYKMSDFTLKNMRHTLKTYKAKISNNQINYVEKYKHSLLLDLNTYRDYIQIKQATNLKKTKINIVGVIDEIIKDFDSLTSLHNLKVSLIEGPPTIEFNKLLFMATVKNILRYISLNVKDCDIAIRIDENEFKFEVDALKEPELDYARKKLVSLVYENSDLSIKINEHEINI